MMGYWVLCCFPTDLDLVDTFPNPVRNKAPEERETALKPGRRSKPFI